MPINVESQQIELSNLDESGRSTYDLVFPPEPDGNNRLALLVQDVIEMLHSRGRDLKRLDSIETRFMELISGLEQPVGDSLQALIFELKGDKSNAILFARRALEGIVGVSHNENASFVNSIAVLSRYGLYEESFAYIDAALEKWPRNVLVLEDAVVSAYIIAQYERALTYLNKFMAATNGLSMDMLYRMTSLVDLQAAAKSYGFTDQDFLQRHLVARRAVEGFGLEVLREKRGQLEDASSIMYLYLNSDRKKCAQCNMQVYRELALNFEDTGMELISFLCRPISDYDGSIVRSDKK